jgi:hypothetical protein
MYYHFKYILIYVGIKWTDKFEMITGVNFLVIKIQNRCWCY